MISRRGFFRSGTGEIDLAVASHGPPYTHDQANQVAHQFLAELVGERELPHTEDDPVAHARANALMVLFSDEVTERFLTHVDKMPPTQADAWRDLLAGGASSEAFGPLTLKEELNARQVEEALVAGRKQRRINLAIGVVMLAGLAVGGWFGAQRLLDRDERTTGALRFEEDVAVVAAVEGGPPVAAAELTTTLDDALAIRAGSGPANVRVVDTDDPDFDADVFAVAPDAVAASVFDYDGQGQVAFVGPTGFADVTCLRASVVTDQLRPLDTVTFGSCADPVGRTPVVTCQGATAVVVGIDVPSGAVELPEGGTGLADAVRVQAITEGVEEFELLSLRGTVAVDPDAGIIVPSFGGTAGEELTFDLTDEHTGTCALTGTP